MSVKGRIDTMSEGDEGDAERVALIEAIAKAMTSPTYVPVIPTRAKGAAKKLTALKPEFAEHMAIVFGLGEAHDMNVAITGVAYVETHLESALRASFIDQSKDDDARLFDGKAGGLLGGLVAKVRIGYAIGLFGPKTYSDLMLLNDIRNAFAHSLIRIDFSHPDIVQDCASLNLVYGREWSDVAAEDVSKARFFQCVINICGGLLGQEAAVMFKRKHRSLVEVLRTGMTKESELV